MPEAFYDRQALSVQVGMKAPMGSEPRPEADSRLDQRITRVTRIRSRPDGLGFRGFFEGFGLGSCLKSWSLGVQGWGLAVLEASLQQRKLRR